jgi:hypothetical protein
MEEALAPFAPYAYGMMRIILGLLLSRRAKALWPLVRRAASSARFSVRFGSNNRNSSRPAYYYRVSARAMRHSSVKWLSGCISPRLVRLVKLRSLPHDIIGAMLPR